MALGFKDPDMNAPSPQVTAPALQAPTLGNVSSDATVAGQMNKILSSGSPLLERAKTRAAQAANSRGLLNSSMGVQAGEEAVLTTAMPMAQQDASTYANQGLVNQGAQNQFSTAANKYGTDSAMNKQQFGQNFQLQEQQFGQQTGTGDYTGKGLIGTNLQSQLALQKGQQDFSASEAALGRTQQTGLQEGQQDFVASESALGREQQLTTIDETYKNAVASATTAQEYGQANMTMQNALQKQLVELGNTNDINLNKLNADLEIGKISSQVYANTQGAYLQSVSELVRQTQITVGEIQMTEGISSADKSKMLADQATLLTAHMAAQKSMYQGAATWQENWASMPSDNV
tara:strand:- start:189 stop:1226 length:1038 start_codon:yes stop_codon:yes gene_type:complete